MRGALRRAAVVAAVLLPAMVPAPAPPAPPSASAHVAVVIIGEREVIDYPGRLQGYAPPRWAWLQRLVYG